MYVNVNESILNNQIKVLENEIKDYKNNLIDISTTIQKISQIWKGNDSNNFNKTFMDFYFELTQIFTSLETYKNFLNNYISACNSIDNAYGNKSISIK